MTEQEVDLNIASLSLGCAAPQARPKLRLQLARVLKLPPLRPPPPPPRNLPQL